MRWMRFDIIIPFSFSLICALWAFMLEMRGLPPADQVWLSFGFASFSTYRACKSIDQ